jgi:hypothetical protein
MGRDPTARERSTAMGIVPVCVPAYHVVRGTHGVNPVYELPEKEALGTTTCNWYREHLPGASYSVVRLGDALRLQTSTVDEAVRAWVFRERSAVLMEW